MIFLKDLVRERDKEIEDERLEAREDERQKENVFVSSTSSSSTSGCCFYPCCRPSTVSLSVLKYRAADLSSPCVLSRN